MAKIVADDLWFCTDCTVAACNGDFPDVYYHGEQQAKEMQTAIERGFAQLGGYAAADFDSNTGEGIEEFSSRSCDCCHNALAGSRHRFAVLA